MKRRYPLIRRGTAVFESTGFSYIPPQPVNSVTLAAYGVATTSGTYKAAIATSFSPDTGFLQPDLAGFATVNKNFDASQVFAATGNTDSDNASRASLAARWEMNDFATTFAGTTTALNVDMLVDRDEPQPGIVSGVTAISSVKWPSFVCGSDVFTSQIPLIKAWQFGSATYPPQIVEVTGQNAPFEQIVAPRIGLAQIALAAITTSTVDGQVIGTANPTDLAVVQVMALVAAPPNQDLTPAGEPRGAPFLSWAWVPTSAYITVPGGWTQVGSNWNPGGSQALFPGDTAFLGRAQIGQDAQPVESAIVTLPAASVGLGIRAWAFNTYSAQVPCVMKCQVRMW